jgi:hypothetical protein
MTDLSSGRRVPERSNIFTPHRRLQRGARACQADAKGAKAEEMGAGEQDGGGGDAIDAGDWGGTDAQ